MSGTADSATMAATEAQPAESAVAPAGPPPVTRERSNPFASAKAAALAAHEASEPAEFKLAALHSLPAPVRTTATSNSSGGDDAAEHQHAATAGAGACICTCTCGAAAAKAGNKQQRWRFSLARLFRCLSPAVTEGDAPAQQPQQKKACDGAPASALQQQHMSVWHSLSPRKSLRMSTLAQQGSLAYSDAEWFDSRSEFSSALSSAASNQAAKIEELSAMLREMYPNSRNTSHAGNPQHAAAADTAAVAVAAPAPGPCRALAVASGPHIPDPPLLFGTPDLQFVPVPPVTGFAAWWQRDPLRSTGYPSPIDQLTGCSAIAQRSHASIPGIWLQETDKRVNVIVKPRLLPPGFPRYTETYDKTHATSPYWKLRRDMRLGTTTGQIYFTTCGMLILRACAWPVFGSSPDYTTEEYIRLEGGGHVLVDRMCCMDMKTRKTATQYIVGHRHEVPPKGTV